MVLYGMEWFGMAVYSMVWYDMRIEWYGMVPCGKTSDKSRGNGVIKVMK